MSNLWRQSYWAEAGWQGHLTWWLSGRTSECTLTGTGLRTMWDTPPGKDVTVALVGTPSCIQLWGSSGHVPGASEVLVMLLVLCHIPSEAPVPSLAAPR